MAVFDSGLSFDPDWNRDGMSDMVSASNPKGSVSEDIFFQYVTGPLHANMLRRGLGAVLPPLPDQEEPEPRHQKGAFIIDGVIAHCSIRLVMWCSENHIELILRPPHTTSKV